MNINLFNLNNNVNINYNINYDIYQIFFLSIIQYIFQMKLVLYDIFH
jgi:hypothetical protein